LRSSEKEFKVECKQGTPQVNYKGNDYRFIQHQRVYRNHLVVVVICNIFKVTIEAVEDVEKKLRFINAQL